MQRFIKSVLGPSSLVALLGLLAGSVIAEPASGTLVGTIKVTKGKKSQNTIVYLKSVPGSYQAPTEPAVLDQKNKVFIPHLLPVQKGQVIRFKNSDSLTHNVHLYWGRRSMLNQSQPPNTSFNWTPPRGGEYLILCNIHPEMMAAILVVDHPFFANAESPDFRIDDVPEGTYALVAVREVGGELKENETEVTIKSGETTEVALTF